MASGYYQDSGVDMEIENLRELLERCASNGGILVRDPNGDYYRLQNHMISLDGQELILHTAYEPLVLDS